jgi:hypothetical protein
VLKRVTEGRPWRGVVLIDGIVTAAVADEIGGGYRRGKRVGEEIEVGGANIEPADAIEETDYLAVLMKQAEGFEREYADFS